jgi:predicted  nucleic acid-binding Zn-ribbon protein
MLNWRRDPDYERRMSALAIRIQQTRNETEQIKKDADQIKRDTEQIKNETEQIKKDTERLRQETEQLRRQNAKGRQLLANIDALCFPDASSSTLPPSIVNDSASSSI